MQLANDAMTTPSAARSPSESSPSGKELPRLPRRVRRLIARILWGYSVTVTVAPHHALCDCLYHFAYKNIDVSGAYVHYTSEDQRSSISLVKAPAASTTVEQDESSVKLPLRFRVYRTTWQCDKKGRKAPASCLWPANPVALPCSCDQPFGLANEVRLLPPHPPLPWPNIHRGSCVFVQVLATYATQTIAVVVHSATVGKGSRERISGAGIKFLLDSSQTLAHLATRSTRPRRTQDAAPSLHICQELYQPGTCFLFTSSSAFCVSDFGVGCTEQRSGTVPAVA